MNYRTEHLAIFLAFALGACASGNSNPPPVDAGTDTTTNTTVTVAAATSYHFKIAVDSDRIARLYINGVLAATSTAALKANIDLIPYIGVHTITGAAAKAVTVRGLKVSKDFND